MSGKFIVLEGIDGAGTTTQAELIGERLGFAITREPSRGPIGRTIRELLSGGDVDERAMALLFAADRIDHLRAEILPELARGRHVLSDRYVLSSIAYQSLAVERAFVVEINRFAPAADLTIFVRAPVDVAERRRASRGAVERYEYRALQERIAANYEAELLHVPNLVIVDGTRTVEEVFAECRRAIESCIGAGGGSSSA
ncbi:MAG TPA: dTMP kinase [Polyangia bacterium]|nr:dTMP kinase [Polyangia bacterium]